MSESYYKYHVFFCINRRDDGSACCAAKGSQELRDYAKQKLKSLNLHGKGNVRVNNAGCLDRCDEGPAVVIYPQGVWYTYVDKEDIDEIIESHLICGKTVERLRI
ncbi:MAG TPA: (2Fe-2S) ferredoxin domain-containing protein [Burkholderiales bacterium]|nr:(2Fe-2S) ferredoxin domain-containing protein [Burkholderiales bacterium]